MCYMRVRMKRHKFPFILLFSNREKTFINFLPCTVSKLVRADVVHVRFFSMSAVDPKYCLLAMDLFTSKKYTYPRKSRHHFVQINRTFLSRYSAKKITGCKKRKDDTAD